MRCCCYLMVLIFIALSPQAFGVALVDISIIRPKSDITTNNQAMTIEGVVETAVPSDVLVSIGTPAGMRGLTAITNLYAVTTDFGTSQELVALLITPVRRGSLYYGPRRIMLAISQDGVHFEEPIPLFVPSGVTEPAENRTAVELLTPVKARFVYIGMVEGWQADAIEIEKVEFRNQEQKVIQPLIQSISLMFPDLKANILAPFAITVLLREGENRIIVVAQLLHAEHLPDGETTEVSELISLFYLPELLPEQATEGRFILSDGYKAQLIIPVDAFDERLKKLEIISVDVDDVSPSSYLRNTRIVEGTAPVLVYRFEARRQGIFPAEATAFLEEQPPTLAVDGITQPPSTWVTSLVPMPVRLTIDLLRPYTLSRMDVHAKVEGGISFAPKRVKILVANNKDALFAEPERYEVVEYPNSADEEFDDKITFIPLPTLPTGRYVQLLILESKQANNIQINEVELWDEGVNRIVPYIPVEHITLQRPALLQLSYDEDDLLKANVHIASNLAFFIWNRQSREWQFIGGVVDTEENRVTIQLNYLTQIAVFEATTQEIEVFWSFNPFSPDGNGIADTTLLTLNMQEQFFLEKAEIIVEVFDRAGKLIRTLIDHELMSSSSLSVEWDGTDRSGKLVHIGPYLYQVRIGGQVRYNGVIVVVK